MSNKYTDTTGKICSNYKHTKL